MEDSTRQTAIRKVDLIVDKVGYPSWMAQNDVLDARYSAVSMTLLASNYHDSNII